MFPSTSVIRILGTEPIRTNCWWPLFQSVVIKQGWLKWPNSSEKLHWKHDSDMTFVLDLCINMRKVTVSSSLHTDLMFSKFSPLRLQQRLRWISHASSHLWFICFQFSLRSVAFWFFLSIQQRFRLRQDEKKNVNIYFFVQIRKMHFRAGGWKHTNRRGQRWNAAFQPGVNSLYEQCRCGEDVYP